MEYFKLEVNGRIVHDYLFDANDDALFAMQMAEDLEQDCPEITRVELILVEVKNGRETARPHAPMAWHQSDADLPSGICGSHYNLA